MQREEFDRLLAGYATKQNSAEENARMMEAALADQALFNLLADEDALRELVDDPRNKAELLQVLMPAEKPSIWSWLMKPQAWALAGTMAVAAVAFLFIAKPNPEIAQQVELAPAPAASSTPPMMAKEPAAPKAKLLVPASKPKTVVVDKQREDKPAEALKETESMLRKEAGPVKAETDSGLLERRTELAAAKPAGAPAAAQAPPLPPPRAAAPPAVKSFRAAESDSMAAPVGSLARKKVAAPTLQYTVLRKNAEGAFVETATGAVLAKGDTIRLAVTASASGYLSVTDSASNRLLFGTPVEPGGRYLLPAAGGIALDEGTEKRLRLSLVNGAYGGASQAAQSLVQQENANRQQQSAPVSTTSTDVVIRFR